MDKVTNPKVAVIVNICSHYRRNFFEKFGKICDVTFLFFSRNIGFYWESQDKLNEGDFNRKYLKSFGIGELRIVPSLISEIIKGNYDVIIKGIRGRFALPVVFLSAKMRRIPFILWTGLWHHPCTFFHKLSFPFTKFIYRHSEALLVYGEHVERYLISLGVDKKKIFIATQALNNSLFDKTLSGDEKIEIKRKIGVEGKKVVLFVGRLQEYKGIYYLLDAAADLINRNSSLSFVFIGTGSQENNLKKIARDKNLTNVFFLGHVDNKALYSYYAVADILVLPSITTKVFKEPWGMVVNEAMNQGVPVIATEAVGAAAGGLVQDGVNGLVVKERSAKCLADAIEKLIDDDNLRREMGFRAKDSIKQWTDDNRTEAFLSAIKFVLNNREKSERKYQ